MLYYVYQTTCHPTNQIYVGYHQSKNIEIDGYLGSGIRLRACIAKYGREAFSRSILAEFNTSKAAQELESKIVTEEFLKRSDTLNLATGGQGGSGPAKCITEKSRKVAGIKISKILAGRSKKDFEYLKASGIKTALRFSLMAEEDLKRFGEKCTSWMSNEDQHLQAIKKATNKTRGRTKENHEGRRAQAKKLSISMNAWQAEHIASKLRGRTKENDPSRLSQSQKISGDLNPSKREDVKVKISTALTGEKNPAFGKFGEASASSKLSDAQRLDVIKSFENGSTRSQIADKYKSLVSAATITKIIQKREAIKTRILGDQHANS